jgi:hypothetical protein
MFVCYNQKGYDYLGSLPCYWKKEEEIDSFFNLFPDVG